MTSSYLKNQKRKITEREKVFSLKKSLLKERNEFFSFRRGEFFFLPERKELNSSWERADEFSFHTFRKKKFLLPRRKEHLPRSRKSMGDFLFLQGEKFSRRKETIAPPLLPKQKSLYYSAMRMDDFCSFLEEKNKFQLNISHYETGNMNNGRPIRDLIKNIMQNLKSETRKSPTHMYFLMF